MRILSVLALLILAAVAYSARASDAQCGGESCDAVIRGFFAFFDRRLHGLDANGRACGDCHMLADHFQLSPASAEQRYLLLQLRRRWNPIADDPLFRPIDADDFRVNGPHARDFTNLRQNGLVRVTLTLPPNIRLVDPATGGPSQQAFVDVWRAVPTVNDVALTGPDGENASTRGPNPTGGYQLDARVADLQEQALGALRNHAEARNSVPQRMLDDLAAFQRNLFTNERVRALAAAVRAGQAPLPDPDPSLTSLEKQGKAVFARACSQCHGGPGQSLTRLPVLFRFHDIGTQCPRPVDTKTPARFRFAPCPERLARNVQTFEITNPDGTKIRRTSSDPGRALLTGFVGGPPPADDWNKFDVPGLRGIRNTAPYFHNNSAGTLEEVVDHYVQFFDFVRATAPPGVVPAVASTDGVNWDRQPTPDERAPLLAYLRRL
jgi:cytochrome c peroxidase